MGSMKENPRYNVISLRITDEEKAELDKVTRLTRKTVSDIMREAMVLLQRSINGCNKGV